jgi:hypothetical protein
MERYMLGVGGINLQKNQAPLYPNVFQLCQDQDGGGKMKKNPVNDSFV